MVIDSGKLVVDGPRDQVLAALSGVKPTAAGDGAAASNLHMHPATQPVQRSASL